MALFKTSVDTIMSAFTKTIGQLERHANDQMALSAFKREEAEAMKTRVSDLRLEAYNAEGESARALTVAAKLKALMSSEAKS